MSKLNLSPPAIKVLLKMYFIPTLAVWLQCHKGAAAHPVAALFVHLIIIILYQAMGTS